MNPLNAEFIRLRSRSGWTQTETADRLAIKQSTISRYDTGKANVPLQTLLALKSLLNDTNPITGKREEPPKTKRVSEEEKLLNEVRQLNPQVKVPVIQGIRRILGFIPKAENPDTNSLSAAAKNDLLDDLLPKEHKPGEVALPRSPSGEPILASSQQAMKRRGKTKSDQR